MARSQTATGRFLTPDEVAAAVVEALANPPAAGDVKEMPIQAGNRQ
jgi:hypothetical protein